MDVSSSEKPTVTVNSASVNVTASDAKKYSSDLFDLAELDKTVNDGYNNTVTITAGGTTYTVYIRRLLKPKIILNPGNSPVGMIMSDNVKYPTSIDKDNAIADFKKTHIFSDVTPNLNYYTDAWKSYVGKGEDGGDYNGDEDSTAMFVFQREAFKDVGFEAYDSLGDTVNDSDVSLELTMTSFKGGFVNYNSKDKPSDITENGTGNNYLFEAFKNVDIRPDVYDLEYTFKDPITGEDVKMIRKIIAISKRGDVLIDANNTVNNLDATNISSNIVYFQNDNANSLYKFRIADTVTDANKTVNNIDSTQRISSVAKGLSQFYNKLS